MVVEVRFEGDDEPERFLIGSREDNTHGDEGLEVYSAQSPLGLALTGAKIGETVEYTLPNGKSMKVELLTATPYAG
jgi:transcription elongation factor GreA